MTVSCNARAKAYVALLVFSTLAISPYGAAADERFRVCSITINSDDEIRTFKKQLPASAFEFVELTEASQAVTANGEPDWFANRCDAGIRCDVLIVSGHFSDLYAGSYGTTFAGKGGLSLSLETLESRSCERSCRGILQAPLEVFLFGCRTLATGLDGGGAAAGDKEALGRLGVPPATADAIREELRNRGKDASNQRRMRFVFRGVPHVYGFSWTAPTGGPIAPRLGEYLASVGDYEAHLKRISRRRALSEPEPVNRVLARKLRAGTFADYRGFVPADDELRHDAASCYLRSERNGAMARLERLERMLDGPSFWDHLPAVDDFLKLAVGARFGADERAVLERMRSREGPRSDARRLVDELDDPVLRLAALRVALATGWLSPEEGLSLERGIVKRLLEPPVYGEQRDVVCAMEAATLRAIELRGTDLSPAVFDSEFAIAALGCIRPEDRDIQLRLVHSLADSREWIVREAAAALRAIRPSDPEVVTKLRETAPWLVIETR